MRPSEEDAEIARLTNAIRSFILPDPIRDQVKNDALACEIRGQQIHDVKKMTPLTLLANTICIFVAIAGFYGTTNSYLLFGWAGMSLSVIFVAFAGIGFRFRVDDPIKPRRSTRQVIINGSIIALIWATFLPLFFRDATVAQKVLLTCIGSGMIGGGTLALAIIPAAARVYCVIIGIGASTAMLVSGNTVIQLCSVALAAYLVALSRASADWGAGFVGRFVDAYQLQEQRATIGVLLKDFEDSSSDWMWQTDRFGAIIDPSDRFCESLGKSREELVGRLLFEFVSLPQAKGSSELVSMPLAKKLMIANVIRDHIVQIDSNLGPRWWTVTGKPTTDADGEFSGFRGTMSDVNDSKNAQDRLTNMARYDQITGLANRNHFYEKLDAACSDFNKQMADQKVVDEDSAALFACMYLDLDNFKAVNDSLGHSLGDSLLREIASRLQSSLGTDDTIARFGGDEFAILHVSGNTSQESEILAEGLLAQLDRPFLINGHTVSLGASVGVAFAREAPVESESLLRNADLALHRAKEQGGRTHKVFRRGMDKALLERRTLELDLRNALRLKQFELHYQPLAVVSSGKVESYEALLRWNHPTRGQLLPDVFIELAEETGLITDIGHWVLKTACRDAASWKKPHRVAVNVSARQVMSQRLLMQVMEILNETGLPPERLELEVTESVLIENPERTRKLFEELRKLGVMIALDDFGTGYSSLSYLVRFPFDKVKIDKSFMQSAEKSKEDLSIVRSILGLASNLGIKTTAEGIESEEQLQITRDEGCDEMQGYIISKPLPLEDIPELTGKAAPAKLKSNKAA